MPIVKIGADPEGFIVDGAGEFVSAHGIIPGTKHEPFPLDKGALQVDGVACEFNITPATTEEEFSKNCQVVITQIEEILHKTDKDLRLKWTPVASFRPIVWNDIPADNKVLGCDPDFNIAGEININPTEKLLDMPLRTAAGHIHIGFLDDQLDDPMTGGHFEDCLYFAKGFYQGDLSTFKAKSPLERERLKYYGHSGSFRPKKYGVELREPSNIWVQNEETRKLVFNQVRSKFKELSGV